MDPLSTFQLNCIFLLRCNKQENVHPLLSLCLLRLVFPNSDLLAAWHANELMVWSTSEPLLVCPRVKLLSAPSISGMKSL